MMVEQESRIAAENKASDKTDAPLPEESAEQVTNEVDLRMAEETQKLCQDLINQVTELRTQMKARSEEQAKDANATSDLRSKVEEKDKKLAETEIQLAESKEKARSLEVALQETNTSWSNKMAEKTTEISTLKSAVDQEHKNAKAACVKISQQKDRALVERDQSTQEKEEALREMRLAVQQKEEAIQMAEQATEANNVLRSAAVTFLIHLLRKEYPNITGFELLTIENLSPKLLPAFEATTKFEKSLSWLGESIFTFYSQNADELESLKSTCPTESLSSSQVSSASTISEGTAETPSTAPSVEDMMVVEPVHQPQATEDYADMEEVQYAHQPQPANATEPTGISEPENLPHVADEEEHLPLPAVVPTEAVSDWMSAEPQGSANNTERPRPRRPMHEIPCRNGSTCRYLLNGNCRYAHSVADHRDAFLDQMASKLPVGPAPSDSQPASQTLCAAGERCKKPMGTCPYAHPGRPEQTTSRPAAPRPTVHVGPLCKDGLTVSGCQNGSCTDLHPGDSGYPLPQATIDLMQTITPRHGSGTSLGEAYSNFIDDLITAAEQSELHGPNRMIYTEAMYSHVFGLEMAIEGMSRENLGTVSSGDEYFESLAMRLANWSDPAAMAEGRAEDLNFSLSAEARATVYGLAELDELVSQKREQRRPVEPVPDLPDYEEDEYEDD